MWKSGRSSFTDLGGAKDLSSRASAWCSNLLRRSWRSVCGLFRRRALKRLLAMGDGWVTVEGCIMDDERDAVICLGLVRRVQIAVSRLDCSSCRPLGLARRVQGLLVECWMLYLLIRLSLTPSAWFRTALSLHDTCHVGTTWRMSWSMRDGHGA
jgi:hypothetical protein